MDRLKELVLEAHRRSLWQVLGLYVAASWIVLQVVEVLTTSIGLPDWVPGFAVVLLLIGLPIVLATAFVQERPATSGQGGESPAARPSPPGAPASATAPTSAPAPTSAADPGSTDPDAREAGGTASRGHRGLLTWRNALLGGAAAFALLALLTAAWMAARSLGIGPAGTLVAKGVLEERSPILLTDFAAEDASLSSAATEAFRVDLSQSRFVKLVEPGFISEALRRMELSPDTTLDEDLGRELAQREGIQAVLTGEIHPAGESYVLSARLLDAGSGEVLVSHRETAEDASAVIGAIDRLSRRVRERVGESLRSIRAEEPLERVTTGDLVALRKYSQAVEAIDVEGDDTRGIALLEEALAEDSAFAMAWRKLGVVLANRDLDRARQVEALTKAYEHRDRLTERESYLATAAYHKDVRNDRPRAITAYENLLRVNPEDDWALNNVGILYYELREHERAAEMYARALEVDSTSFPPYFNLVVTLTNLGRYEEAWSTLEALERNVDRLPYYPALGSDVAASQRDWDRAESLAAELKSERAGDLFWRASAADQLAELAQIRGRLDEAEEHWRESAVARERMGAEAEVLDDRFETVWTQLQVLQDTAAALATAEALLTRHPLEAFEPLDRPYGTVFYFYALARRPGKAREVRQEWAAAVPEEQRNPLWEPRTRAALAFAQGRWDETIEGLRRTDEGPCLLCGIPQLAWAHEFSGDRDGAIATWERYVDTDWFGRTGFDAGNLALAHERLGRLYEEAGDLERASLHYARLVELWEDADPALQPRVAAARQRLEAILAARG